MAQKTWEEYRLDAMVDMLLDMAFKGFTPSGAAVALLQPTASLLADKRWS